MDNQFGPATEAAVIAFQQHAGIGVDGQVGPQTQGTLFNDSQPALLGGCEGDLKPEPNYQGGAENDFGTAIDVYLVDPEFNEPCYGWVERSENGGPWTRVSQVYTIPANGGEAFSPYEWDGVGAKTRVHIQSDGYNAYSGTF